MKRRTILLGLGATAGGAALGTGAFDLVEADRTATITVTDENEALLAMKPVEDSPNSAYAEQDDNNQNEIGLVFDENAGTEGGSGLGQDSVYTFDDVFEITNQGTQDVGVAAIVRTDTYPDGIEEFSLYTTDPKENFGNEAESNETVDDPDAVELTPGETTKVGVRIVTGEANVESDGEIDIDIKAQVGLDGVEPTPGLDPRIKTVEGDDQASPDGVARRGETVEVSVDLADAEGIDTLEIDASAFGAGTPTVNDPRSSVLETFEVDAEDTLADDDGGDKSLTVRALRGGEVQDSADSGTLYVPNVFRVGASEDFGNIRPAVDSAGKNDAVVVGSGTYQEALTISQPLFLDGPNAGVDAVEARPTAGGPNPPELNDEREAEAYIVPPSPDPTRDGLVSIEANDVFVDGFTLSGLNPYSSAVDAVSNPEDITDFNSPLDFLDRLSPSNLGADFGVQIENDDGPKGVVVRNNVVRAFGSYGVFARGKNNSTEPEVTVARNLVTDLPGVFGRIEDGNNTPDPSLRAGVRIANQQNGRAGGTVEANTMTRVFIGVEGDKADLTASDNFVESERVGIRAFRGSTTATIDNNILDSFRPESFQNAGIWTQAVEEAAATGNTIANSFSGVEVFNSTDVSLENTQVDRCLRGVYAYNYADVTRAPNQQPETEDNPADSAATITGGETEIRNCLVGLFADDREQANGPEATLVVEDEIGVKEPDGPPSGINKNGRAAADENVEDAVERGENAEIVDSGGNDFTVQEA